MYFFVYESLRLDKQLEYDVTVSRVLQTHITKLNKMTAKEAPRITVLSIHCKLLFSTPDGAGCRRGSVKLVGVTSVPPSSFLAHRESIARLLTPLWHIRPTVPYYKLATHRTPYERCIAVSRGTLSMKTCACTSSFSERRLTRHPR